MRGEKRDGEDCGVCIALRGVFFILARYMAMAMGARVFRMVWLGFGWIAWYTNYVQGEVASGYAILFAAAAAAQKKEAGSLFIWCLGKDAR